MSARARVLQVYETRLRRRNTFRYAAEFERNQWLSTDELRHLQWQRLQALLRHAYDDVRTPDGFARLPLLSKADIRRYKSSLQSTAFRPDQSVRSQELHGAPCRRT